MIHNGSLADLYCSVPRSIYKLACGRILIAPRFGHIPLTAAADVEVLLQHLSTLRTADAHTESIARISKTTGGKAACERTFSQLLSRGLVVSGQELFNLGSAPRAENIAPLSTLVIITHDRLGALANCLDTYMRWSEPYGARFRVLVIDGTTSAESSCAARRLVDSCSRRSSNTFQYIGFGERQVYIEQIVKSGIPSPIVQFALQGRQAVFSAGALRNLALLLTVGELILMVDDDTEGLVLSDMSRDTLSITNACADQSFTFFETRELMHTACRLSTCNIMRDIESLLGRRINRVLDTWPGDYVFEHIGDGMAMDIRSGDGIVRTVQMGVAGDSGRYTSDWLSSQYPAIRSLFKEFPHQQRTAKSSRETITLPLHFNISANPRCMAMAIALDNRSGLPPFPPHHRNEDGVFGSLLRHVCPDAYFGSIPRAIYHNAFTDRKYCRGSVLRMSDLMIYAICNEMNILRGDFAANCTAIGAHLLAEFFPASADVSICDALNGICAKRLDYINQVISSTGLPHQEASDLEELQRELLAIMKEINLARVTDLSGSLSQKEHRSALTSEILNYGTLIYHWPSFLAASSKIHKTLVGAVVPD